MDYLSELEYLSSIEQKRSLRVITDRQGKYVTIKNKQFLDFSSNDYLGIAGDKGLREKFLKEIDLAEYPFSSSASRLMSGNFLLNEQLESILSKFYKGKEVLVFGSGFQANTGIIPALIGKKDVIFADKQVHASIIHGILLSGAKLYRYKHNDMTSLRELLEKHRSSFENAWIITESIFSMDGDIADIKQIIEYKNQYSLSVFVDGFLTIFSNSNN
ncbi:MAG: aminotransferase class I/II-fold pyridoxal phosphate-dependent enzyme, partial [Candidatus Riflemargulisbacteria bacterium]